jgi:hypothetical protein
MNPRTNVGRAGAQARHAPAGPGQQTHGHGASDGRGSGGIVSPPPKPELS